MASTALSTVPKAVIMMICVSSSAFCASASTSMPVLPGMRMSMRATSISFSRRAWRACVPSAAVKTLKPSSRITSARLSRIGVSSSAISMRACISSSGS